METTTMQLYVTKEIVTLISVYTPPGTIEADVDLLIEAGKKMILAGNFDAKHITWISRNNNAVGQVLLNHYSKSNYIVTVPISPTHIPDGSHSTLDVIDFAFLSNITSRHMIKTLGFLPHSDHKPVTSTILDPIQSHETTSMYVCGEVNWDYFTYYKYLCTALYCPDHRRLQSSHLT